MRRVLVCVLALFVGLQPAALWAQQGNVPRSPSPQVPASSLAPQTAAHQPTPSVEVLGVSFERVKRELRILPPSKTNTPLKLEYYIEVVAEAPPFILFAPDEPSVGRVPGSAPTHADMMRHITPLAFSAPAATLVSVGGRKGSSPKIVGQDFWQTQARAAKEAARRKKIEEERQKAVEAERLRQQRLKDSIVVSPPK
jgi:hypothetical protein